MQTQTEFDKKEKLQYDLHNAGCGMPRGRGLISYSLI